MAGRYGQVTRTPKTFCASCGKLHDAAGRLQRDDVVPSAGDIGMCNWCGAVNIFDAALRLRPATPEELAALEPDELREITLGRVKIAAERAAGITEPPRRGSA